MVANNTDKDTRTPMRKAVDWLIYEGKIKQDKDLQEIFNKSKSTISAYLTGRPGKNFVNQFEKHFGLSLKEFETKELDMTDLSRYIIETHAMLRVLTAKAFKEDSLKDAQRVVDQLLKEEREKK